MSAAEQGAEAERQLAGLEEIAERAVRAAQRRGAQAADAMLSRATEFEVKVADGAILTLTQATARRLGLRAFVDGSVGLASGADLSPTGLEALAERAVAAARAAAADPHNGLLPLSASRLRAPAELFDPAVSALTVDTKIDWAHRIEAAARSADRRVRHFRASGVGTTLLTTVLCTSDGALRSLRRTGVSAWSTPVASADGEQQTESWYDAQCHLADLESPETIGRMAAARAVRMLGARPVPTQTVPVLFEPAMAAGLMGALMAALDGDAVRKRASFLHDRLGQQIASPTLTLIDDPHLPRGLASTPFDGEGMPTQRRALIDAGILTTFLYDGYTARRAGVAASGHAQRSSGSLPQAGPSNLSLAPGKTPAATMARHLPRAFLLTRGLGRGLNTISGEYSRGANGLWLEHGEVVQPVQAVTIAGDFARMLNSIDAVGDDPRRCGSLEAPTLRVAEMTVSGS